MRDVLELRRTLAEHADLAPDGRGLLDAARRRAGRIRRRRRAGSAGVAIVLAVALGAAATVVGRFDHSGGSQAAAPPWRRSVLQVNLGLDPSPGGPPDRFGVHGRGLQYMSADMANDPSLGMATVVAYDPGTYDPSALLRGKRVTVNGHPAYYVAHLSAGTRELPTGSGTREEQDILPAVGWHDPSGVWVVVFGEVNVSLVPDVEAMLLETARAVRVGPPRDLRAPVWLGYVPAGLPVSFARIVSSSSDPEGTLGFGAGADDPVPDELRPGDLPLDLQIARIDDTIVQALGAPTKIAGHDTWYLTVPRDDPFTFTSSGAMLVVADGSCTATIRTADRTSITYDDLKRMVEQATFVDCTRPETWLPPWSG